MHTIHHTRAVIIKSTPSKEADKMFWLFSRELGLVVAIATGIRKSGAKLKGQLVDYAFVDVDLVQGRDVWRLVSATEVHNPLEGNVTHPLARAYVRTLATLERFLIDEGVHEELFAHIVECGEYFNHATVEAKIYDTLAIWRTLVHLGYIAVQENELGFFNIPFAQAVELIDEETRKRFIGLVNETITQTHL